MDWSATVIFIAVHLLLPGFFCGWHDALTSSTVGRDSSSTACSSKVRWNCSETALRSIELTRFKPRRPTHAPRQNRDRAHGGDPRRDRRPPDQGPVLFDPGG